MALPRKVGALFEPAVAVGDGHDLRLGDHRTASNSKLSRVCPGSRRWETLDAAPIARRLLQEATRPRGSDIKGLPICLCVVLSKLLYCGRAALLPFSRQWPVEGAYKELSVG